MVILVLAVYLVAAIIALKVILDKIEMRKQIDAAVQFSLEQERLKKAYYQYISQVNKNNDK